MVKNVFANKVAYTFDGTRKGAKYSMDGIHWMNNGEFAEVVDKAVKGFPAGKDANTAFDMGSDIPETSTSVKSSKATLTCKVLGNDLQETLDRYFERVHSTNWDWVSLMDESVVIYNMNAGEFREFTETWASFDKETKRIRYKATSSKMVKWFEERL